MHSSLAAAADQRVKNSRTAVAFTFNEEDALPVLEMALFTC